MRTASSRESIPKDDILAALRADGATVIGVIRKLKIPPRSWKGICRDDDVAQAVAAIVEKKRKAARDAKIAANLEAIEKARAKFAGKPFVDMYANDIRDAERAVEEAMATPMRSLRAMGVQVP